MHRILLCFILVLYPLFIKGQLFMLSDYYSDNALAINPAYAGSKDALDVNLFYRNNWNGFEGSPKSLCLSAHAPFYHEEVGLGLLILNDQIGFNKETNFIGNYAYRMNLGYGKLAMGFGVGLSYNSVDMSKLAPHDAYDELLENIPSSGTMIDFSTGFYYSNRKYFLGFSLPLFLTHKYDYQESKYVISNNFNQYNYFVHTGYLLDVDPKVQILPAFLMKYHHGTNTQIEMGSRVIFNNKFSVGASYRSKNMLVSMFQFSVNNQLQVAYSYDYNLGNHSKYMYNSNEIKLSYLFEYSVNAPQSRQF